MSGRAGLAGHFGINLGVEAGSGKTIAMLDEGSVGVSTARMW